ncbi:MAG: hypothetical protein FWC74_09470 [Candidatus Bathyarchaeota archaeon]|nr:hypothetical protein [Candidatus Termitimicrobium sp.]
MFENYVSFAGLLDSVDVAGQKAVFGLMTDGANLNSQGLTCEDMQQCLKKAKNVPLQIGENYQTGHHQPQKVTVGQFTDITVYEGYALGTAAISDPIVTRKLQSGELGPISWNIRYNHATCSNCNTQVSTTDWKNHSCIKNGSAYAQLRNAEIVSFDFVPKPAYPDAGFKKFSAAAAGHLSDKAQKLIAYACVYELSQQQQNNNNNNNKEEEEVKKKIMSENTDFSQRMGKIEEQMIANTAAIKNFGESLAKISSLEPTITAIKTRFEAQDRLEHATLVDEAYKNRAAAGVAAAEQIEKAKLEKKTSEELKETIADAKVIKEKIDTQQQKPPAGTSNKDKKVPPAQNAANAGQGASGNDVVDLNQLLADEQVKMGYRQASASTAETKQ